MENDNNSRRGGKEMRVKGGWKRGKKKQMEGLKEYTRKQPYSCICIAILPGATTSGRLDQSFSTSAHHDIGTALYPPTFTTSTHVFQACSP